MGKLQGRDAVSGVDYAQVDGNPPPKLDDTRGHLSFAIVRAALGTFPDPTWKRDAQAFRDRGVPVGPFVALLYPQPGRVVPSPREQMLDAIDHIGPLGPMDLCPWIDVEFGNGRAATGMTPQDALDYTLVAWRILNEHFGTCGIYASARVGHEDLARLPSVELQDAPKWLAKPYIRPAHAPAVLDPHVLAPTATQYGVPPTFCVDAEDWDIQQYQGDAWGFPGFRQVDVNRWHICRPGELGRRVARYRKWLGLADGDVYDDAMGEAVVALQRANGFIDDGAIGPLTFARMWPRPARG
jgi:hypothetical protein